jgi:uncharacterized protein (DUF885 family)
MKKAISLVVLAICLTACGGGGGDSSNSPASAVPPPAAGPSPAEDLAAKLEDLSLEDFYAESYGALIRRSPETVVWQALESEFPLETVGLNDLSDQYQRDTYAMAAVVLDGLANYDRDALSPAEKLDYDIYAWYLEDIVATLDFIYYDFPASYSIFGEIGGTELFFESGHPMATRDNAEDYITRLLAVETKMEQLAAHLEAQRSAGIVEPGITMRVARDEVRRVATGSAGSSEYYLSFSKRLREIDGLTQAQIDDLESRALAAVDGAVRRGYERVLEKLDELLANAPQSIGVGQYARGAEYYANRLRHHTTSQLTAAEIHQLGLDELVRIHAEMRAIFDQLGYSQDESLQALFGRVASDGGIVPAADVLATYEQIIDVAEQQLDTAFDIFPEADVVVVPDPFGGFYVGPSFDGMRPGAFYAGTTRSEPRYRMPSLTYHEAVPGHHTQIALSMEQDVPAFRKLVRFTGFVEGWALYAERLAWELGWYKNDVYGDLGRLQFEALRAARLVMDTGIHSLGWSFDEAVRFNEENVGWSTGQSQGAAGRYSIIPGQATAYMVGMLVILDERDRAKTALGEQFDLIAFHRALLSNGAVPLALLPAVIDQFIEATLAGQ